MIPEILQIGAILVAGLGGIAGLAAWAKVGPERKKILAEAFRAGVDSTEVLNRAAIALLDPYLEQIKFLRQENVELRTEMADARSEIASLRTEIRSLRAGLAT